MSNTLLDLLAGHFQDARLGILQTIPDHSQRVRRQARKSGSQLRPYRRWPAQHNTIDGGDGRCRILFQRQCLGDPEYLARRNVANHDLLTLRGRLLDAQISVHQDEERLGICALIEYGSILRKFCGAALLQNLVDLTGSKP